MAQEETRKGPWTEQEDSQLVGLVRFFGDRRWDFIAKVSGLNRTGKSCRLRWVNYLHPGLKRGKMTPQEEKLVLELHSKWGNRWSRIARILPGRTDNEIKNYWRTYTRKQAQQKKPAASPPSPSASSSSSSSSSSNCYSSSSKPQKDPLPFSESGEESFYDTGGPDIPTSAEKMSEVQHMIEGEYPMEDIWKEIAPYEDNSITPISFGYGEERNKFSHPIMSSPTWEYNSSSLWQIDGEEHKMFPPIRDLLFPCDNTLFTGYSYILKG